MTPVALALRALKLGDFLTAVPALRALRRGFPGHRVVLAAPSWISPLALLDGAVDEVLPATPLEPLGWPYAEPPDVAVNLHGRGPRSHEVLLALRPRRLIAFCSPNVFPAGPDWRDGEHEVARWCRLLSASGVAADPRYLLLPAAGLPPARRAGATVVHPGAASVARRWPIENFAAVARAELRAGRHVVLTGTAEERDLCRAVAALAPGAEVVAGETPLLDLASLVAFAGAVVCGDTGVAHLATAFGTPSVVVFGPVPPSEWGPPAWGPHRALWAGRRGDPHASVRFEGLLDVTVGDVVTALDSVRGARLAQLGV